MRSTVTKARLIEKKSDERDVAEVVNDIRDNVLNRVGLYTVSTRTLGATPATIFSMALLRNTTLHVQVAVAARATDGSGAGYTRFGVLRENGGVVSLIGAVDAVDKEDVAAWDVSLAAVGSNVQVSVTGDAGRTIDWTARVLCSEAPLQVVV